MRSNNHTLKTQVPEEISTKFGHMMNLAALTARPVDERAKELYADSLAITVSVECEPPNPEKIPLHTQYVEGACETQACSEKAVQECRKQEDSCDSDSSGSPDNLISPLRSCPFRCQDFEKGLISGTNRECRVATHSMGPDGDTIVHHQPLYANVTCGGCMSKECLARVPDACRKAGSEMTGDEEFDECDVSESGKLEYVSWLFKHDSITRRLNSNERHMHNKQILDFLFSD